MIGETISHYRIVAKLGEGGMGVVYKAEDTKLRRIVALKFLRRDMLAIDEHRQRFLREAQAAAALDHPNVCTIFEIDEADGQTFLAMALVEGQSVSRKIAERPLRLDEALDIAIQTAHGLQAAHEKGIVHRDIKPSNLIVNLRGQVKIMDFGLVQVADRTRLTQTTEILGTLAYMSPDQAQCLPADRRSDIWALGVLLYEMVTGRLPFEGEHDQAVIYSIINEEPEPITALRVGVPTELDRIVAKAMAKNPSQRYQHVEDMAVDLENLRLQSATGKMRALAGAPSGVSRAAGSVITTPAQGPAPMAPPAPAAVPIAPAAGAAPPVAPRSRAFAAAAPSFQPAAAPVAPPPPTAPQPRVPQRGVPQPGVPQPRAPQPPTAPPPRPRGKSTWAYVFAGVAFVVFLGLAAVAVWRFAPWRPTTPPDILHTATGDMRLIPAGEFIFGANNDIALPGSKPAGFQSPNPQQVLRLPAFYMDVTEVSNAAYKQFCDATKHPYPPPVAKDPGYFETKLEYPVVNVSFEDAEAFARWAGKRLPTEQEWEKAARGDDGRIYPWGNTLPLRAVNVQGPQDGYAGAAPVKLWPENASPYGLLNMSGNVWEWTTSPYQPTTEEIDSIARAWPAVRQAGLPWSVIKGGSFLTPPDDPDLTAFFRAGAARTLRTPYQGFRCAKDAAGE